MKRPIVNIAPAERIGRVVIGIAGTVFGLLLLSSSGGAIATGLQVLLVLAGFDLVITGALGHCPLYRRLGHLPASLGGSS